MNVNDDLMSCFGDFEHHFQVSVGDKDSRTFTNPIFLMPKSSCNRARNFLWSQKWSCCSTEKANQMQVSWGKWVRGHLSTVYHLESCRAAWFPSHNLKWTMPFQTPPSTLDNLQKIEIQYSSWKYRNAFPRGYGCFPHNFRISGYFLGGFL